MAEVPENGVNAVTSGLKPSRLWHQRLGHMSEKGMKMLVARGKLLELKKVDSEFCEPCVLGKKKKVSFVKMGQTLKAQKLELVHTVVYGLTPVSSLGGSNYYVTFIDDSTRKMMKKVPGTPQQNRVAERMNRTLNERARSVRLNVGLPKTFWADAVNTATYLINRGISIPVTTRTDVTFVSLSGRTIYVIKLLWYKYLATHGCN